MATSKIKKGDTVKVITGRNKGKEGKVTSVDPKNHRIVVEGVNKVKRHTKPNQKAPQGGILTKEAPLAACKVMVVCPSCKKATRTAQKLVNGKFVRACKKCGEVIDEK